MNKYRTVLFLSFFSLYSIAQENKNNLPDGADLVHEFILSKMRYPQTAIKSNIEGRVIIRFAIDRTGCVVDEEVIRGIHPDCDSIALAALKSMPRWYLGEKMKRVEKTYFLLPISFKLYNKQETQIKNDTLQ